MELKVICLEEPAFYDLIDSVVKKLSKDKEDPWVDGQEAMRILNIKSKTTLQSYRDNSLIKFSQPSRGIIIYERQSLYDFLEKNVKSF